MRRIVASITILAIFFALNVQLKSVFAEQTSITISSEKTKYSVEEQKIEITVKISNAKDLFGYSLSFSYPQNKVEYVDLIQGSIFQDNGKDASFQRKVTENGIINIGSAILGKSDGIDVSGTLFTLICKPKFIGKALFAISDLTLMNSELMEMQCEADSFEIEIYELSHEPILSVDPGSIDFGNVQFAKIPTKTFKVFNSGEGEISGTLDSYTPWLKVTPKRFTGETEITITADTTLLPPNQSYKGNIGIQSNGGQIELPVSIYVEKTIDSKAPPLTILTPDDGFKTKQSKLFFLCETEPGSYASINKQRIAVDQEDGVFYYRTILDEGMNTFIVSVWDAHNNTRSETIQIELDTTPPMLILDPVPMVTSDKSVKVTGKTDYGSFLSFNGAEVLVKKDGTFQISYQVIQKINQLIFTSKDAIGNKLTKYAVFFYKPVLDNLIVLTIGKTLGVFNDKEFALDTPPQIVNGRVFVPINTITDIYGADMEWNQETKEIHISLVGTHVFLKIGSVSARIESDTKDTQYIVLDGEPFITNQRTMVPLRFISEAFGSVVEYLPSTKEIMIKF
ncbi:MAG: hypothetical protein KAH01_00410 [Caldisericia bacterium]|nr:hypothetical protein [Caldisericia bacterium]